MAERGRFELPEACASAVFKTAALNHSTISPESARIIILPAFSFFQVENKKKIIILHFLTHFDQWANEGLSKKNMKDRPGFLSPVFLSLCGKLFPVQPLPAVLVQQSGDAQTLCRQQIRIRGIFRQ